MDVYKTDTELNEVAIREDILQKITSKEAIRWFQEKSFSYRKLMAYYRCAIMEVETKFNVLNEEFSLQYDRNPISSIKSSSQYIIGTDNIGTHRFHREELARRNLL